MKYNPEEIQKYINDNHTFRETQEKFQISSGTLINYSRKGLIKFRNRSDAQKLARAGKERKIPKNVREKISKSRKAYLAANPDKVPYLLNHKSKGLSYPEKYFSECLKNTAYVSKYRVLNYELDFADIENKIDLEIDGDQHFLDKRIVEHDKKRNKALINLGWKIVRIKWSEFQKIEKKEKIETVNQIIERKFNVNSSFLFFYSS